MKKYIILLIIVTCIYNLSASIVTGNAKLANNHNNEGIRITFYSMLSGETRDFYTDVSGNYFARELISGEYYVIYYKAGYNVQVVHLPYLDGFVTLEDITLISITRR